MMRPATAILPNRGRTLLTTDFEVTTSGASETFSLNLYSPVGFLIDWGDGSDDTYNSTGLASHVYATADSYTVKMRGQAASFRYYGGTPTKVTALLSPIQGISGLTSAAYTHYTCTNITSIPSDYFRYCPGITSFEWSFKNSGISGSIPADLFRYNILATSFSDVLYGCTGLTGSIPADLFRYNVLANRFAYAFIGCTGLSGSIPEDLFRYNTATWLACEYLFADCYGLSGVPADLFRYNTLPTNVNGVFRSCTGVPSFPDGLFRYNTTVVSFASTFQNCHQATINPYIFFASGEEGTRFLNQSVNFTNCFYRSGAFTGTQGTAPALWDCDFGTGTPTTTDCFQGHDANSVDNYGDIPAAWL